MKRVWYNQGLSNVYDAIRLGRRGDMAGELRFLASHSRPDSPVLAAAHEPFIEPVGIDGAAYAGWCLEVCCERRVDLFIPNRGRIELARRAEEFAALGTQLRTLAAPDVLHMLGDKVATARDLAGTPVPLPEHRLCRSAAEFDAAYDELRRRHAQLCVKPTRGIYGAGFYVLEEDADPFALLLLEDRNRIGVAEYSRALHTAAAAPDLMLMEYLPGEEHSVDAFAHHGRVVAATARGKQGYSQRVETAGPPIEIARFIASRYSLSGVFNLQTKRRADGTACFLEVNPRMSGGAHYAEATGLLLPYWAVAIELGLRSADEIPPFHPCTVAAVNAWAAVGEPGALTERVRVEV